jgi:sterol desaturase/sphingolipid hydroxylase (fatty acid hydroxylase superfamily)
MTYFTVENATHLLWLGAQAFIVFVSATFVFDVIHYILHRFVESRSPFLRSIGNLHLAHHDYFDTQLRFNEELYLKNFVEHSLPEYFTQMTVCLATLLIFDWMPVVGTMCLFSLRVIISEFMLRGQDTHHRPLEVVPGRHGRIFVESTYHALHHIYRDNYISSYTTLFDRLMGTCCQLRGRRVTLTGASGALGSALKRLLEKEGVSEIRTLKYERDYSYNDYSPADAILRQTDILVLCHGAKNEFAIQANCDSFVALIERFRALNAGRRLPCEIWAVGSESEIHPAFGDPRRQLYSESKRAFARHARRYYSDPTLVYRHIVPAGYQSPMGWGLISAGTVAWMTMFLAKRGFRYIPVTYTGFALANYFKFVFFVKPAPAPEMVTANLPTLVPAQDSPSGVAISSLPQPV